MHGKISHIFHDNQSIYAGLSNPFLAVRYHSLIVDRVSLPECLKVSAWTGEGEIMGLRHRKYCIEGLQFHPESIFTEEGMKLLKYFLDRITRLKISTKPL